MKRKRKLDRALGPIAKIRKLYRSASFRRKMEEVAREQQRESRRGPAPFEPPYDAEEEELANLDTGPIEE